MNTLQKQAVILTIKQILTFVLVLLLGFSPMILGYTLGNHNGAILGFLVTFLALYIFAAGSIIHSIYKDNLRGLGKQ